MIRNKRDRKKRIMFVNMVSREPFVYSLRPDQAGYNILPRLRINLRRVAMRTFPRGFSRQIVPRIDLPRLTAITAIDLHIHHSHPLSLLFVYKLTTFFDDPPDQIRNMNY